MKEKIIEKWIIAFLSRQWAFCEWQNWWKVRIEKEGYNHSIKLQSKGTPDIICFWKWYFFWIEVKKDEQEVNEWLEVEKKFNNWEEIPKNKNREFNQILKKNLIIENWGHYLLVYDLEQVIDYMNNLFWDIL